jgi:transcriptional regulator GlxA family with amidase domain
VVHRSPIDYLNYYRVECAAHLLTDGNMNVAEVAARCGFADSSAFIKQFRRYKGDTPKRYKSRMLESRGRDQPFGP